MKSEHQWYMQGPNSKRAADVAADFAAKSTGKAQLVHWHKAGRECNVLCYWVTPPSGLEATERGVAE